MPLAKALSKNLPAENTQTYLSRPNPTKVVVPIEEEDLIYNMLKLNSAAAGRRS